MTTELKLMSLIDENKEKFDDNTYLEICNLLKNIHISKNNIILTHTCIIKYVSLSYNLKFNKIYSSIKSEKYIVEFRQFAIIQTALINNNDTISFEPILNDNHNQDIDSEDDDYIPPQIRLNDNDFNQNIPHLCNLKYLDNIIIDIKPCA